MRSRKFYVPLTRKGTAAVIATLVASPVPVRPAAGLAVSQRARGPHDSLLLAPALITSFPILPSEETPHGKRAGGVAVWSCPVPVPRLPTRNFQHAAVASGVGLLYEINTAPSWESHREVRRLSTDGGVFPYPFLLFFPRMS